MTQKEAHFENITSIRASFGNGLYSKMLEAIAEEAFGSTKTVLEYWRKVEWLEETWEVL